MNVKLNVLELGTEPRVSVQHQPALMMALRTGRESKCLLKAAHRKTGFLHQFRDSDLGKPLTELL